MMMSQQQLSEMRRGLMDMRREVEMFREEVRVVVESVVVGVRACGEREQAAVQMLAEQRAETLDTQHEIEALRRCLIELGGDDASLVAAEVDDLRVETEREKRRKAERDLDACRRSLELERSKSMRQVTRPSLKPSLPVQRQSSVLRKRSPSSAVAVAAASSLITSTTTTDNNTPPQNNEQQRIGVSLIRAPAVACSSSGSSGVMFSKSVQTKIQSSKRPNSATTLMNGSSNNSKSGDEDRWSLDEELRRTEAMVNEATQDARTLRLRVNDAESRLTRATNALEDHTHSFIAPSSSSSFTQP